MESLQILALRDIFRTFYNPVTRNQISNESILAKSGLQNLENKARNFLMIILKLIKHIQMNY